MVEEMEEVENVLEKVQLDVGEMKSVVKERRERDQWAQRGGLLFCEKEINELKAKVKWCNKYINVGCDVLGLVMYFTLAWELKYLEDLCLLLST